MNYGDFVYNKVRMFHSVQNLLRVRISRNITDTALDQWIFQRQCIHKAVS